MVGMIPACTVAASNGDADWKGDSSARSVFVPAVAGCQGRVRPFRFVHSIMERRAREIHCRGRGFGLVGRHQPRLPVDDGRNGAQGHAVSESGCGAVVGVARWVDSKGRAHTRPDRRYSGFRNQYDGLELLHLRVDENRVLCTDFDQYHCVINRWPCAPLDAGTWPPDEYDRWLDEHWDDPAEVKAIQYRANAIVGPKRLPDRWIQACLWTITPHDVVDIRPACGKPDTIGNHG